jgi:hypothetical protein
MMFPTVENALLVAVDLQAKLMPAMSDSESIIRRAAIMVQGAAELGLDIVVSEQYPKGLGNTVPELATWLGEKTPVIAKTSFSVFGSAEFCAELAKRRREVLIFSGIESHVCLLQSVLDAVERGYEVIVASDAVMSRKFSDCHAALEMMRSKGVSVISTESILFMLLRDAAHPAFKTISKLVK